ncbi:OLC1v1023537C1 [Oldenlandia corymbosa var. corymbosa]|uniref:OLC1v1023537C1 n=1 Tax=Oldenlandia corymbosa var. corymbosa TaxID=529605 RepID=A0AAV1C0W5_OLDCO|nr:OLC1v1023537C1 [Oldenlandia corymbosa var. corymbosa]
MDSYLSVLFYLLNFPFMQSATAESHSGFHLKGLYRSFQLKGRVELEGISVWKEYLKAVKPESDSWVRAEFDFKALGTFLPPELYTKFRQSFIRQMAPYYPQVPSVTGLFETCFNLSAAIETDCACINDIPEVELILVVDEGKYGRFPPEKRVRLETGNVLALEDDDTQTFCMPFAPTPHGFAPTLPKGMDLALSERFYTRDGSIMIPSPRLC